MSESAVGLSDGSATAAAAAAAAADAFSAPLHIRDVIPPTEFYHGKDDSIYTNAVAKLALERAVQARSDWCLGRGHSASL